MTENNTVTSNRDKHLNRLREKYPDKAFEDDEEIYGQIGEDYDQYEQDLGRYKEDEKAMSDMFANDPRSAQFLTDMHQGKSPWASYIRLYGPELQDSLDDPDTIEQIAQAEAEYTERVAQNKQLEAEYEQNMQQSIESLRQFQEQRGLSEDQLDEVFAALIGIVRDGVKGKFLPETLDMMLNAINHDVDVASATEEGRVAGRNSKITEKLRTNKKGDGIATMAGKSNSGNSGGGKSIFDLASEATGKY